VLRTDYQGLGTPGVHQYLVGAAEARSVLDIVRAARRLHPRLSRRVVLAGHSQGGHAALWAAALAPAWTPELRVRGTVALAPASHIATQAQAVGALTRPSQLSPIAGLILRGLDAARPSLDAAGVLSERARGLFGQTLTRCLEALGRPDSFGGLAPAALFAPGADLGPLVRALAASDPEHLRIRTPVRVEQGTTDEVVFQAFTDALVRVYRTHAVPVSYRTYAGADHIAVVRAAAADVNRWVARRLRR
jgi:pimeloyl-ACP methyl ester carboxylesterase